MLPGEGGMNAREIWTLWVVNRRSTAEIARKLKMKECDVDSVITRCLNAQHDGSEMPFERGAA